MSVQVTNCNFSIEVQENFQLNQVLRVLDVVNQENKVDCTMVESTYPAGLFSIELDSTEKNCELVLRGSLDYENRRNYNITLTLVI
ncbi:hypothetical protein MAR_028594 [Mya arenaria]|uniref:Uncharacterized protein n=1 Tax=Mya arenaria TaxID=6604 RepID=A0ABY7DF58_MYAAR|nr:hypothetical protein MAR_028594 [Mya arenaria]